MSSDATKLLEAALKLPPEARAAMAGSLLDSLDTTVDADAEGKWEDEIARRLKDLDSSAGRVVSSSDARRKILGLGCRDSPWRFIRMPLKKHKPRGSGMRREGSPRPTHFWPNSIRESRRFQKFL